MSVSVWSHPFYQWYNTHSIYDIISNLYMAQYALYMTSHPRFMTSQCSTHDIKAIISHLIPIISDSTSTVSLSSLPDYRSCNPHCMYDNTTTIWMTSYEPHMTSHPLFMISLHGMTSHPLYLCHHTHDTCYFIHCSWTITYSVLIIPHILYVCHETHYMWHQRNSMWHHTHSLWHNNTVFMMTHRLYPWQHTHSIWHHIHYTCDITATVCMKIHLLCLGHHTPYIWHLTWCMNDNKTTLSDNTLTVSV